MQNNNLEISNVTFKNNTSLSSMIEFYDNFNNFNASLKELIIFNNSFSNALIL